MKRPTIADIARRAGVSTGAVSYALNGQSGVSAATRARILEIADQIGWRPNIAARALSAQRAHAVALIVARPIHTLGVEPFFMQFVAGVEGVLAERDTALLLQVVPDHQAAIAATRSRWAERRIDGVILTDVYDDDQRVPVVEELHVPAVIVGRPRPDSQLPAVWSDDAAAVTAVVDYLVALGHRRIARIAGPAVLDYTRVRIEAFHAAMRRHGLRTAAVEEADYSWEDGTRATRRLLTARQRPTAITYDNDLMAVAALGVARELGLGVPDDLSLVAGDDSQLCLLTHPPLTALSRDVSAYGAHAARTLLAAIDGAAVTSFQDRTAHLVPRGSTAPITRQRTRSP